MQVQSLGLMFTVSEYFNYDITYAKQGLKYIFLSLWKKGCNTEPNHKTLLQAKEMAVSGLNRTLVTSVFETSVHRRYTYYVCHVDVNFMFKC